jgi:formylglycine-generating enzyme
MSGSTAIRISTRSVLALAVVALIGLAQTAARADLITYDMVTVGNAGNANDTTDYGGVAYEYQIGKYDVTIGQYTAFLNSVAVTDPYSLYNTNMATNLNVAGISRSGSSGSYNYSVIGSANKPITYVSWFDAARFANWMQNGQGSGSTETGAYTLVGGQTSGTAPAKNAGAAFYIPTEDEWYKAAYYSPLLNSGSGGYYVHATQSDVAPGNTIGGGANQANWRTDNSPYPYSVTQSSDYYASQNYLTDVGAFSNSASFYGTFDQSGNVFQWNDLDGAASSFRGLRGGLWNYNIAYLLSSFSRDTFPTSNEADIGGFRLASPFSGPAPVPELDPAGMGGVLALLGGALGLLERRRLKTA